MYLVGEDRYHRIGQVLGVTQVEGVAERLELMVG